MALKINAKVKNNDKIGDKRAELKVGEIEKEKGISKRKMT